jgi:nitroimidazol reductase NimA-like FMN-containing flavoprotein (pyridoxamine 5'-phosphate oxidase superfamily)
MKTMRNIKRQITFKESIKILENGEYGILSVVSDSKGYGIPMSYAIDKDNIYLHCANEGQKLDAINSNPNVSFSVVGKTLLIPENFTTKYESVIIQGCAFLADDNLKLKGLNAIIKKYSPDFIEKGNTYIQKSFSKTTIIVLPIINISGKASK